MGIITGCASTPLYQVSPTVPTASIKNSIEVTQSYNDSISIIVYENNKPFNLFYINSNKVVPEDSIAIEANKSSKFGYRQSVRGGDTCNIDVKATLIPNKKYVFVGGTTFSKSIIPFLPNRGCEFGIKDLDTGRLISD